MSKNLAAHLRRLQGIALRVALEEELDRLDQELTALPTRYPNRQRWSRIHEEEPDPDRP